MIICWSSVCPTPVNPSRSVTIVPSSAFGPTVYSTVAVRPPPVSTRSSLPASPLNVIVRGWPGVEVEKSTVTTSSPAPPLMIPSNSASSAISSESLPSPRSMSPLTTDPFKSTTVSLPPPVLRLLTEPPFRIVTMSSPSPVLRSPPKSPEITNVSEPAEP